MSKHDELILAVRKDAIAPLGRHGFWRSLFPQTFAALSDAGIWIAPRRYLENDPSYVQLIPYVALANEEGVLCYERAKSGSESRLHGQRSIGIGGHVEFSDVMSSGGRPDLSETLELAAGREIFEEVGWHTTRGYSWLGCVYDNDNGVGRVHLGIVGLWYVKGPLVTKAEHAIANPRTVGLDELEALANTPGALETWSEMIAPFVLEELRR